MEEQVINGTRQTELIVNQRLRALPVCEALVAMRLPQQMLLHQMHCDALQKATLWIE